MKNLKKSHLILIIVSVLILSGCIGITAYLLLSNYQSIRLFKQAQDNFRRGDPASMELAEAQLLQVIRVDEDNESAYIMLGAIAGKKQIYPEQVYYCHMACRLNPLSEKNRKQYIRSLCFARYFDRLENFLTQQTELTAGDEQLLLYAAARNSNLDKHKHLFKKKERDLSIAGLAHFLYDRSSVSVKLEKLKKFPVDDPFLKQEILASYVELYLDLNDPVNAGRVLEEAYVLNQFAFAPALGRFYANFDSFGKALPVFEKYLKTYHDPAVAIQTAEIYCLLKQTGKIAKLREQYQSDPGNGGMLCCYYFDALTALTKNDMATLKELTVPLRKNINTPLAAFMFLCADLQSNNLSAINDSYNSLLRHRNYLDLQSRADKMISNYLKQVLKQPVQNEENLLALANMLYKRNAEPFIAKLILLLQKKRNAVNVTLLNDAMKRFSKDHGIVKIAIEYFISQDFVRCRELINYYKKSFPAQKDNMLRYEIILAMKKQDFEQVSQLFQKNFDRGLHAQYWEFASSFMREKDLLFLSKDRLYSPFCKALLLLKKGQKNAACDILEKADTQNNPALLFFAAKTLGENSRNRPALERYARIPANSPYRLAVLLNTAELKMENGEAPEALELARQAYRMAPDLPETQFCYADKLHKNNRTDEIPDIVKWNVESPLRDRLYKLYIAGMHRRIKMCDVNTQREKLRELCTQLLLIDVHDRVAIEHLAKTKKTP